jgi:tRNA(Ile)-lysidine synthase
MPGRLPKYVSEAFLPHPPQIMGVAVSGGSDSMALLHLLSEFCKVENIELRAVTVNHGLRKEAADEAATVERHCNQIGVRHDTLVWQDWSGKGNLQQAARDARYSKMADWARENEITTIAVGHTADDQAETVLMRIARRAGVDGLSGMQHRSVRDGIVWVRPLLRTRRKTLQAYLEAHDIEWIDDPSNEDERFDRIKARKALEVLSDLGIDADALSEVAEHLAEARRALEWQAFLAAKQCTSINSGAVVLDETILRLQPDEIQRRLIVKAVSWVSGSDHGPRRNAVATVRAALSKGQAGTLDGCHIRRIAARLWVFREYEAVRHMVTHTDALWDGRWRLIPSAPAAHGPDLRVRALGQDGLEQCPDWRATGRPHVVLLSTPSIWSGDTLISAPLAGFGQNWQAELEDGPDTLFAALLSH